MNIPHNASQEQAPAAVQLGMLVREGRKSKGYSLVTLAEKIGRPREWLNRLELGYSQFGDFKPPSSGDLQGIINALEGHLTVTDDQIFALGELSAQEYQQFKKNTKESPRKTLGRMTHTEVILGEQQIVRAITNLIQEQHSDAIIRNTGVKGMGSFMRINTDWKAYRHTLGNFLDKNPNALLKRIEYVYTPEHIKQAKNGDSKLAGSRSLKKVHNVRAKFKKHNPFQLHVVIGQREAILALPPVSGKAGSNAALLIRDKVFVESLRTWYDEVLWDGEDESKMLDFTNFDQSFEEISKMYGFPNNEQ